MEPRPQKPSHREYLRREYEIARVAKVEGRYPRLSDNVSCFDDFLRLHYEAYFSDLMDWKQFNEHMDKPNESCSTTMGTENE